MNTNQIYKHTKTAAAIIGTVAVILSPATGRATYYDNDEAIDFIWTPPSTPFSYYRIYVSVDGGPYTLDGISWTESCSISGTNSHFYQIKVSAVNALGAEGQASPESDPVVCDTVAPTRPAVDSDYTRPDFDTVEVSLKKESVDENFDCYQVKGGQYSVWTDTDETDKFRFTVDPYQEETVYVRGIDLAGNTGSRTKLTILVDYDNDGIADVDESNYGTDPYNPDSDDDGASDGEEVALGTDPAKDDSAPYIYATPVKGWSSSFCTLANISEKRCSAMLKIYDSEGIEKDSRQIELQPLETLKTWDLIGNIYSHSNEVFAKIVSTEKLSVQNGRWSTSSGWQFNIPELDRAAGSEFVFPLSGWSYSWFNIANPGWDSAQASIQIYNKEGNLVYSNNIDVPAQGMRSSWNFLNGSVYDIASPAVVTISTDKDIVVEHGSWASSAGWGFNNMPSALSAGKTFYVPVWGWSNAWIMAANTENIDANLNITIFDGNGIEKTSARATLPANGFLRTWDLFGNIYNYATPAVVVIDSDRDIVIERGNWSASAGFASSVPGKNRCSGTHFIYPVSGWSCTSSNIANASSDTADVVIDVYDASGRLLETFNTSIPPMGIKTTLELVENLYEIGNPALIEITSNRHVIVDSNSWMASSEYAGWSFNALPDYEDVDNDGLPDEWEIEMIGAITISDAEGDIDADGLSNIEEWENLTDPKNGDSDNDGLADYQEVNPSSGPSSNPNDPDTDDDGLNDYDEKSNGSNPRDADTDNDGISDGDEVNRWGTDPSTADSDYDTVDDGDEIELGTDPARSASVPYIFAAPVKGWSDSFFDICNVSYVFCTGILEVRSAEGQEMSGFDFALNPLEVLCSWEKIGDIYSYSVPAFVRIISSEKLYVDNGRWSAGAGWGLDVHEVNRGAGTQFVLPISGWENIWFDIGNPGAQSANVTIKVYNISGSLQTTTVVSVPAFGMRSSWDFLGGSVYTIADPAVVHISSDRAVVVEQGSWTSGAGYAFTNLPIDISAGRNFTFPVWGWSESWFTMANTTTGAADVAITVFDETGRELESAVFSIPANGNVDSRNIIDNIYSHSSKGTVSIQSNRDIVVVNYRCSASAGWAMVVPPEDICSGRLFRFAANGWSSSASSIANCSAEQAAVEIKIFDQSGVLQATYNTVIPPSGMESTWYLIGNLYSIASPAAIEITSDQHIIVDNGRWSSKDGSSGWGFTILPH